MRSGSSRRAGQDFNGDVAAEFGVAGAVDLAHPAGAEGVQDFVGAETGPREERHGSNSNAPCQGGEKPSNCVKRPKRAQFRPIKGLIVWKLRQFVQSPPAFARAADGPLPTAMEADLSGVIPVE